MREKQQINKDTAVASGIWKFGEKVSQETLVEQAKEWAEADKDNRYVDLHVRKCSKTQFGIGFKFILSNSENDPLSEDYENFFYRITDELKRKFGNDFAGWDVSSFTDIII